MMGKWVSTSVIKVIRFGAREYLASFLKENAVIRGLPMSLRQTSLVQVLVKGQGITPPVLLIQYSGILKTRIPPAYIVLMLVRITVDGSMSIGLGSFILRTGDFSIDIIAIYVVQVIQGYFVLLSNPSAPPTCTLFQNVQIVEILLVMINIQDTIYFWKGGGGVAII